MSKKQKLSEPALTAIGAIVVIIGIRNSEPDGAKLDELIMRYCRYLNQRGFGSSPESVFAELTGLNRDELAVRLNVIHSEYCLNGGDIRREVLGL